MGLNLSTLRSQSEPQPGVGCPTDCATQAPLVYSWCVLQSLEHRVRVVITCAHGCAQSSSWRGWTAAPTARGFLSPRVMEGPLEEGAQILIAIREPSIDTL